MIDLEKYVELRTEYDDLSNFVGNHDKSCPKCIKLVECVEIGPIYDRLDEIGENIDKLGQSR